MDAPRRIARTSAHGSCHYSEACDFLVFLSMPKIIATWWLNANSSPSAPLTEISRSNFPSLICFDVIRTAKCSTPSSGSAVFTSRFITTVGNHMPARCSSLALSSFPSGVLPPASPFRDARSSSRSSGAAKNSCRLYWDAGVSYQVSTESCVLKWCGKRPSSPTAHLTSFGNRKGCETFMGDSGHFDWA